MQVRDLTKDWQFSQADTDNWLPVAKVPTNVHIDLLANGVIPDLSKDSNEQLVQWVGERAWTYRLELPKLDHSTSRKHVLVFDGLDTLAQVKLNGKTIASSDNMWIPLSIDITDEINGHDLNTLEIVFASALLEARRRKDSLPDHRFVGGNGEFARFTVRKAQYHWGWDWGPVLMTCGPWRPVRLESYTARVAGLHVEYKLNKQLDQVAGSIVAITEASQTTTVRFEAYNVDHELVLRERVMPDRDGVAKLDFRIPDPRLWYPSGHGKQDMYKVTATLCSSAGTELHSSQQRVGFRRAELVQDKDAYGKSFYFRINNIDIFCGGTNWIPADSFLPSITADRYRRWLEAARDGNQVMIRVWGGGVYEDDAFYDACDELGLLVWQDFMFACGNYPCTPDLLASIRDEAKVQVGRLRNHPSVVLYCGNNEDYQIREFSGLTYEYEDKDPENWLKTNFPARYIYEKLLPDVVQEKDPTTPYHPGSPWSGSLPSSDPSTGDLHMWSVYHGDMQKYQSYGQLSGRFVSEFGMAAHPHIDTLKAMTSQTDVPHPQSRVVEYHTKADNHMRIMASYLLENLRPRNSAHRYIHLTQLVQADALAYAYRDWRRLWGAQRRCGGALTWQLNDVYPCVSWSMIDYLLRKKPSYYTVKRALAPVTINVRRKLHDWTAGHQEQPACSEYSVWVASRLITSLTVDVELRFISIVSGRLVKDTVMQRGIECDPNTTTEILDGVVDNEKEEPHVLAVRLWVNDTLVARDADWPQPLKYHDMPDRGVSLHITRPSCKETKVTLSAERPVKCLVLDERDGVNLSDNAIDLMPDDPQIVYSHGGEDEHTSTPSYTYYEQPE